jgi:AraC-like DNA-binding protein
MKYLVRSGALIGFSELVELYGQSPLKLLDDAGIPPATLRDPESYLSYPALARLLTLAAKGCEAPDFGARLGSRQGLEAVGALGTLLCLQGQVGDAVSLINRHIGFHARGVSVDVQARDERVALEIRLAFGDQLDCAQLMALSVALLVRSVSQLHGTALRPLSVALSIPSPPDPRGWRSHFGCMPEFAAPISRVQYPAESLTLPVRISNSLRQRLSAQWRGQNAQSPATATLVHQVERAIIALLPTGDCDLANVAKLVELSPRVLQLRLQRESLSFGELMRRTRERLAREHLARSDTDLTSLAMNLGFCELAVFSRAFKLWTGLSPREWRRRNKD